MNAPMAADDLNLMKFGIGQPVPRQEDPTLLRGEGRYTDDMNLPNQAWCVMVRSQVAHGVIKGIDTAEAKTHAGRAGRVDRRRPQRGGLRPAQDADPGAQPRRLADEDADAPFARHRQGALRRRSGGLRRRRDPGPGQGRGRGRHGRHRVAARGHRRARGDQARRAASCSTTRPATSASTISTATRAKVAEAFAKAAHVTRLRLVSNRIVVCAMEPRSAIGRVRRRDRPLHPARRQPGRLRPEAPDGRPAQDQARPDAHPDRQCRRLVRHEGLALSRVCRPVPCLQDPRPSGEMDRRALGQLPQRPAWPRPRLRRRAGARQGRQVPGRAPHRLRQCRRLSRQCRPADGLDGRHAQSRRHLPHAADRGRDQGRLHPHLAGRRLSRRRAARGQLLHGAADRHGGARDGHRQRRDAQAQPHQARGDALQDGVGHDLRQRRVHHACSTRR